MQLPSLDEPLSEAELDRLDSLLLERGDDDTHTDGMDEGVIGVSELDGFLTAIVSAPEALMPSRWLPALWGDVEPVWESIEDSQEFIALVMRHMNGIAAMLLHEPESFEPLYMENRAGAEPVTIVDEWCEGYVRGVELAGEPWTTAGPEVDALLAPIRAFTSATAWYGHELDDSAEADMLRDAIVPNVLALYAYWLERRMKTAAPAAPIVRSGPRVGRNEPCPCGSGRKYKHCCLQ